MSLGVKMNIVKNRLKFLRRSYFLEAASMPVFYGFLTGIILILGIFSIYILWEGIARGNEVPWHIYFIALVIGTIIGIVLGCMNWLVRYYCISYNKEGNGTFLVMYGDMVRVSGNPVWTWGAIAHWVEIPPLTKRGKRREFLHTVTLRKQVGNVFIRVDIPLTVSVVKQFDAGALYRLLIKGRGGPFRGVTDWLDAQLQQAVANSTAAHTAFLQYAESFAKRSARRKSPSMTKETFVAALGWAFEAIVPPPGFALGDIYSITAALAPDNVTSEVKFVYVSRQS